MRDIISVSNINKRNFVIHIRSDKSFTKRDIESSLIEYRENELFIKLMNSLSDGEIINYTYQYISLVDEEIFVKYNSEHESIIVDGLDDIFKLEVDRKNHTYNYTETDKHTGKVTEYPDKKILIRSILEFIDYVDLITKKEDLIVQPNYLFKDMRMITDNGVNTVISDDTLKLVLFNCYQVNPEWMNMKIVLKETNEIIGEIEFNLKSKEANNFSYMGNVSYEIYSEYQNKGYCTKALKLVKEYIRNNAHDYNKVLFISTLINNIASQMVALKCGGELYYEGKVPANSKAHILSKVDEVKIYKIGNL